MNFEKTQFHGETNSVLLKIGLKKTDT